MACMLCRHQLPSVVRQTCSLPCRHVFCRSCFDDYCERKQSGSVMRIAALPCPVCRRLVDVKQHCSSPVSQPASPDGCRDDDDDDDGNDGDGGKATVHKYSYVPQVSCDELILPNAPAPTTSDVASKKFVFPDVDVDNNVLQECNESTSATTRRSSVSNCTDNGSHVCLLESIFLL